MGKLRVTLGRLVAGAVCIVMSVGGAAAADRLEEVKARGRLIVGVTESSPPFSFRDGERGIVGYDVDLAGEVAKRLGIGMEKIPIINAERIPSLQQDRVDLGPAPGDGPVVQRGRRTRNGERTDAHFVSSR